MNNSTTAYHKQKVFQQLYRSGTDFRLKVTIALLLTIYIILQYLLFVFVTVAGGAVPHILVQARADSAEFSKLATQQMLLSPETLLGTAYYWCVIYPSDLLFILVYLSLYQ